MTDFRKKGELFGPPSPFVSNPKNTHPDKVKTPNYRINPNLDYYGTNTRVKFNGTFLKQDKITYSHGKIVTLFMN